MTPSAKHFAINGPAIVTFSMGRSSAMMLKLILDAHGGKFPTDLVPVCCNTGKEREESLQFRQDCIDHWGVHIWLLEWRDKAIPGEEAGYEIVGHNSASRNGEPYDALLRKRGFLPNPAAAFCAIELKIRTTERFAKHHLGWTEWTSAVGFRADEMHRVRKARARNHTGKDAWETVCPLAEASITKQDVATFWAQQPFDLGLPNINGKTPHGNCDLCWKKGYPTLMGLIREDPERARWWAEAEAEARGAKPDGARFRIDRPSYAEMIEISRRQGDILADLGADDNLPCGCHD
jgi:3'-phosphoadenosine 5'-phosphosulfate sulfotransferase (PAPS reductase)/FAD synthetase